LIVGLFLLALILLLLDSARLLDPVRSRAEVVVVPALDQLSQAGRRLGELVSSDNDVGRLQARIRELEAQSAQYQAENIKALAQIQENERLRQQVRLEQERPWQLVGGAVLTFSPEVGRQVLQLGIGSNQGIVNGMAVIAQQGSSPPALIGVVETVSEQRCTVLLITDFNSAISAQVYREQSVINGLLIGRLQRDAALRLEQVDRATPLAAGDILVTASLSSQLAPELPAARVPANIPIGVVDQARIEGNSQEADVRPYIDPGRVDYAWVLISVVD
jgi:rod shape-determining protein MreC